MWFANGSLLPLRSIRANGYLSYLCDALFLFYMWSLRQPFHCFCPPSALFITYRLSSLGIRILLEESDVSIVARPLLEISKFRSDLDSISPRSAPAPSSR